jgi:hypothetical protein
VHLDALEQRRGLQAVAAGPRPGLLDHLAGVDRLLDAGHHQPQAQLGDLLVAVGHDLGEVVTGVDVHHREGQLGRGERLDRHPEHDGGVLAAGEQQHRPLELGGDLADDVDGLGFQCLEVAELVGDGRHRDARLNPDQTSKQFIWATARRRPSIHSGVRRTAGR